MSAADQLARWRVRTGYPVALVFFWLAAPTLASLAAGAGVALFGLFVRGSAAGHIRKVESITVSGPYAYTRNPLYLGSVVLAAGFVIAAASWTPAAIVAAYFAVFYPAVMKREERYLRSIHGAAFDEYAARVPLFWPRFSPGAPQAAGGAFSWPQYLHNREWQAALGLLAGFALLWLRMRFGW